MNRRTTCKLISASGLAAVLPPLFSNDAMLTEFIARWETTRDYTLAMMDAMPAEYFDFRPTPEQMTFGRQFTNIGFWNTFYIGFAADRSDTFASINSFEAAREVAHVIPEPEVADRETTRSYLVETFAYCLEVLQGLTEEDLATNTYYRPGWLRDHSNRDLLMRAYMHTAHHRGQAVVYLRLKGITPPGFVS